MVAIVALIYLGFLGSVNTIYWAVGASINSYVAREDSMM